LLHWIALFGAFGVGAIVVKLLDVLWLQRVVSESERRRWLRAEKLRAYSALARDLVAFRAWDEWQAVSDVRQKQRYWKRISNYV
jgi:hypothetical protein